MLLENKHSPDVFKLAESSPMLKTNEDLDKEKLMLYTEINIFILLFFS